MMGGCRRPKSHGKSAQFNPFLLSSPERGKKTTPSQPGASSGRFIATDSIYEA